MRFYTKQHQFYCGIDLHARTMYVCIMDHEGTILIHRLRQRLSLMCSNRTGRTWSLSGSLPGTGWRICAAASASSSSWVHEGDTRLKGE